MRSIAVVIIILAWSSAQAQTTHLLQSGNLQFIPAELTIQAGDCIALTLVANHTVTEVNQKTWEANGNVPNGGFNYGPGTPNPGLFHEFCLDDPGVYHYVCIPHAAMGMKGRITVTGNVGVGPQGEVARLMLGPNPAASWITVEGLASPTDATVLDATGRLVMSIRGWQGGPMDIRFLHEGRYTLNLGAVRLPFMVLH